jgi:hypothetical protein
MPLLEIVSLICCEIKSSNADLSSRSVYTQHRRHALLYVGHTSWRRAWRDLTCQEQDEYLQAIVDMKRDGIYDEFVWLHNEVALVTHGTEQFLPWHRYVTF